MRTDQHPSADRQAPAPLSRAWWARWPAWLDDAGVQARHESQFSHRLGRFGYPFQVWLAVVWCVGIVGPMAAVELSGIAVTVCWLLRLPFVWRGMWDAVRQPAVVLLAVWAAWMWALAAREGLTYATLHDLSFQRWAYAFVVLWAVMDRRMLLVAGLCVGYGLAMLAQLGEYFGYAWNVPALVWSHPPAPDPSARISGWWHQPALGGAMLVAGLGLHLGPALLGRGWVRVVAIIAAMATVAALLATGTRGAWVAASGLVGLMMATALVLKLREGRARGVIVSVVAIVLTATLAAVVLDGPRARVGLLISEVRSVLTRADLDSDMGGRVLAARAALDAIASSPVAGIGPGNFFTHVEDYTRREGITIAPHRLEKLKTAHSTPLHLAATQGLVGAVLWFGAIGCAIVGGLRPRATVGEQRGSAASRLARHLGSYAGSPAVALVGLCCAGMFETIPMNTSTAALATVLVALCATVRPEERDGVGALTAEAPRRGA